MISSLALLLIVAAPVKLAAPGFQTVNFDSKLADLYLDRFIVLAKNPDLVIVTSRDISQVLGMERQRELVGCGSSNCVAELAGALGADAMLSGTVAKSEKSITLVIHAIRANDASELVSATVRADNEDALQDWIETHAKEFGAQLVARTRGEAVDSTPSWPRWALLTGGIVVGGTGALVRSLAEGAANDLRAASRTEPVDVAATVSRGRTFETSGNVLLGVGAALIVTGAVLFIVQTPQPQLAFIATPNGVAVVAGGSF